MRKKVSEFFDSYLSKGDLKEFDINKVLIGSELAFNLNLKVGNTLNLMSSAFVSTPLGSLPKQESFKVAGIFSTGFIEFDQNVVFINISDALSIFEKKEKDQNIEVYLKDPLDANSYKKKFKKLIKIFLFTLGLI